MEILQKVMKSLKQLYLHSLTANEQHKNIVIPQEDKTLLVIRRKGNFQAVVMIRV
jgi:hypothetical protein